MIRMLLAVVLALLVAGWVGTLIARDPGYVLIAWDHWSLETSVWFALVLALLVVLLLRVLMLLLGMILGSRTGMRAWNRRRLERRAQRQTTVGLLALAEGDFDRARRTLVRAAERVETPLINYLGAARAAHERGDFEQRDTLLQSALDSTPRATLAVGITQAELQISRRQWEQALATLLPLRREAPRNSYVLRMLRTTYQALEDWQGLLALTGDLRKNEVIGDDQVAALERRAWSAELQRAARSEPARDDCVAALERTWSDIPRRLKRDPQLIGSYAGELLELGADDTAETAVRTSLRKSWHEPLVELYGRIAGADVSRQVVAARSWLSERPNSDILLLTLGRLCARSGEPSKAREYLEASVRLRRSADGYAELGRLCADLGEHEQACEYFTEAMRLQRVLLPESMDGRSVDADTTGSGGNGSRAMVGIGTSVAGTSATGTSATGTSDT